MHHLVSKATVVDKKKTKRNYAQLHSLLQSPLEILNCTFSIEDNNEYGVSSSFRLLVAGFNSRGRRKTLSTISSRLLNLK
jgi:hypothetical protein